MFKRLSVFVFGRPFHGQLPARVRVAIEAQEVEAEKLIGWSQLALVLFFLSLYIIAPKPADGMLFAPVPYVLSIYLIFTATRLILTYTWRLPGWFLILSVIGDIALLMALIWSFHLQYEQPPPFYLKAPTLLYVFIFISLRTLRYTPLYVLCAGMTAAVGWMVMVWYAVEATPTIGRVITRDYVEYLTSNLVLIGAEVDKVISILLVTLVLAVALVRARRLLVRSVADAAAAGDLSRLVSPEIAAKITGADRPVQPGDGEIRMASVLYCDVAGFSGIAEQVGPHEVIRTLNDYFAVLSAVIERHRGVITELRGDAMLVTFNAATDDADHATHALRAAVGIQAVLADRRFGPGIAMPTRCGINTGELVAGVIGTPERLLVTVHGDEVNVAARLEALNKQYGTRILASEPTIRAAADGFAVRPIGSVAVRGRNTPVTIYAVDGLTRH